jgi:ABC-2 type transport system ATP-binding protein
VRSLTSAPPTLEELFMRHYHVDGDSSKSATAPSGEKVGA